MACIEGNSCNDDEDHYIIGTLVVQIVSANLNIKSYRLKREKKWNPYAKVSFNNQIQRTIQLHQTNSNPKWPRLEQLFFDVMIPIPGDDKKNILLPNSMLSISLYHCDGKGGANDKYPEKKQSGEEFCFGNALVDTKSVISGKINCIDEWIPLSDGMEVTVKSAEVRVICEYESTNLEPRIGDQCRILTEYVSSIEFYPIPTNHIFQVDDMHDEFLSLSFLSPEGWICTFPIHRNIIIIVKQQENSLIKNLCYNLHDYTQKVQVSPMAEVLSDTINRRILEDGLIDVSIDTFQNAVGVFETWISSDDILETTTRDFINVLNLDGKHGTEFAAANTNNESVEEEQTSNSSVNVPSLPAVVQEDIHREQTLPQLPYCPITGQPMIDPVVAADGHTYERTAVLRWLETSNRSPMTGTVLSHKNVVPNYALLSNYHQE